MEQLQSPLLVFEFMTPLFLSPFQSRIPDKASCIPNLFDFMPNLFAVDSFDEHLLFRDLMFCIMEYLTQISQYFLFQAVVPGIVLLLAFLLIYWS
jgi:hypothetical protein